MSKENPRSPGADDATVAQAATLRERRGQWAVILVCAIVTLAAYGLILRLAPGLAETDSSHIEEILPWISHAVPVSDAADGEGLAAFLHPLGFGSLLLVLFAAYGVALWAVANRSSRSLEAAVFWAGTTFLAYLATAPVLFSNDVYACAAGGRVFAFHHQDPAIDMSELPPDDLFLGLWGDEIERLPYGPLWTLISAAAVRLGGERAGLTVLIFRTIAVLGVWTAALLLWGCLRRIDPPRAAQGLVFFLWNPLVVIESGLSGHNDAAMVALCVAGIALHLRKRPAFAMACLTLSALVKYSTGALLPLYLMMGLREFPTWRQRGQFLASTAVGAIVALAAVFGALQLGLRSGPAEPAARGSSLRGAGGLFRQRYTNSIHELLYRALRLQMGEAPDDVRVVDFYGWWVTPTAVTDFRAEAEETSTLLARLAPDTPLLVVAPQAYPWLRVFDPATGHKGYVLEKAVDVCDRPAVAESDPVLLRWELGQSPTGTQADVRLKLLMWAAFSLASLWAVWYASNLPRFLAASAGMMLASYWLVCSWFFPWYVMWAIALAAFTPHRAVALLSAFLSATALTLYATLGYDNMGELEWVFTYRSVLVFMIPPLGVLAVFLVRLARQDRSRTNRCPSRK